MVRAIMPADVEKGEGEGDKEHRGVRCWPLYIGKSHGIRQKIRIHIKAQRDKLGELDNEAGQEKD